MKRRQFIKTTVFGALTFPTLLHGVNDTYDIIDEESVFIAKYPEGGCVYLNTFNDFVEFYKRPNRKHYNFLVFANGQIFEYHGNTFIHKGKVRDIIKPFGEGLTKEQQELMDCLIFSNKRIVY